MSLAFGTGMVNWEPGMPETPVGLAMSNDMNDGDGCQCCEYSHYLSIPAAERLWRELGEAIAYAKAHPVEAPK